MSRILGAVTTGAVVLAVATSTGCGGSPSQPSSTTSGPSAPTLVGPLVRLDLQADDTHARDAIASLSEVVADASASLGKGGLTFAIDFGDGATATTSVARHTYASPGAYTVTATITDGAGQKASVSKAIAVKSVTGAWYQVGYVTRAGRIEVRRLTLTAQDGLTVRGTYQINNAVPRAITGTLTAPRHLHLVADGGAALDGDLPSQLGDDAQAIVLAAQGDSADGLRLEFQPILGQPTGAAPSAILTLSFDGGVLGKPIASLTPVLFDGRASRGTDLTSFIEFGDGTTATGAQATRVIPEPRDFFGTARLTVVDRFGRSDAVSSQYKVFSLVSGEWYWRSYSPDLQVDFDKHDGLNYTGYAGGCYLASPTPTPCGVPDVAQRASATLSGIRDIVITVPGRGFILRGTIAPDASISGVDHTGRAIRLFYTTPY